MRPTGELKTLVIENEGAPGMFQDVIRKIVNNGGFTEDEVAKIRSNVLIWGDGGWSGLKLDNPADLSMIERGLAEYKPDILFMEPFKGLWKGDENSSTEMANVLDALNGLGTRFNCGVMLTHHERKSGVGEDGDEMSASRGSSVLEAAAAVMERWRPVQNGSQRELKWTKWRFAQPAAPIRMQFDPHRHGYDWVSEDVLLRQILAVMEQAPADWYTVGEIAEEIGESERNVRNVLKEHAKDDGRFKAGRNPDGGFRYRLTQSNGDEDSPGGLSIT
jgi:hypothetical protein